MDGLQRVIRAGRAIPAGAGQYGRYPIFIDPDRDFYDVSQKGHDLPFAFCPLAGAST